MLSRITHITRESSPRENISRESFTRGHCIREKQAFLLFLFFFFSHRGDTVGWPEGRSFNGGKKISSITPPANTLHSFNLSFELSIFSAKDGLLRKL